MSHKVYLSPTDSALSVIDRFSTASAASTGFVPDLVLTSTLTRSLETAALTFPNQFVSFQGSKPTAAVQSTDLLNDQVTSEHLKHTIDCALRSTFLSTSPT
jgi:hypothetical protein